MYTRAAVRAQTISLEIDMPPTKTLLAFPAAVDPDEIEVTLDDELPTEPAQAPPERTTGRPSAPELAALVEATRVPPAWLEEPRFAVDPESGRLVLAEPFLGRQRDALGNTFLVECPAGTSLDPPATLAQARAIRTALVGAALRGAGSCRVVSRSGAELAVPLDDQWRREIVTAFREGDAGVRQRG